MDRQVIHFAKPHCSLLCKSLFWGNICVLLVSVFCFPYDSGLRGNLVETRRLLIDVHFLKTILGGYILCKVGTKMDRSLQEACKILCIFNVGFEVNALE